MAWQRTLLSLSALASCAVVYAQEPPGFIPLSEKKFKYPDGIPLKVDTDDYGRGAQFGVNQCGPKTEGQTSVCQTALINSLDDFCLWAPPKPNSTIGDTEGEAVAWCTKPGHGARVIPKGALTGVQFMRTPDYVQVVGTIDQTQINIAKDDFGGEMDSHGADRRGNPLGGIFYSNAFPSSGGDKNKYEQVIEWHNFMGSNTFCLKACDPAGKNAAKFCEHRFDRIGCEFNAPSKPFASITGTFESCKGENQDFPGVYFENGKEKLYEQPPEALGPITSVPYTARIPASSDCVAQPSSLLYAAAATVTGTGTTTTSAAAGGTTKATSTGGKATSAGANSVAPSKSSTPGSSDAPATVVVSSALAGIFSVFLLCIFAL